MQSFDAVRLAVLQIRAQRLRSVLMMAGVTVAVAFLIALVSILHGTREQIIETFSRLGGATKFRVSRHPFTATYQEYLRAGFNRNPPPLTVGDANAIAARLPEGTRVYMVRSGSGTVTSRWAPKPAFAEVNAIDGDYLGFAGNTIGEGRTISPVEFVLGSAVAVLEYNTARAQFPGLDPIGRPIIVNGVEYRVVGVLTQQPDNPYSPYKQTAFIPLRSAAATVLAQRDVINSLFIETGQPADVPAAKDAARAVMRVRHHLRPREQDDFGISSGHEWADLLDKQTRQFALAGVMLPAVGLVVGALVIANIMLVAVAERTREIGMRKALGARRGDIAAQFLSEATLLSALGATVGVVLGLAVPEILKRLPDGLPAAIEPWSIAVGLLLGTSVGIVAGVYPAVRAARLDPIRALRHDA